MMVGMRPAVTLLALLVASVQVQAGDSATAATVTERARNFDRALDLVFGKEGATVVLLVDATPSLKTAGFERAVDAALRRNAGKLGRIGVAFVGRKSKPAFAAAVDRAKIVQTVHDGLASPRKTFRNVYADVRRSAGALGRQPGPREVLLVTLENGDLEDDLEATVKALKRVDAQFSVVTREAFLSDTYWVTHAYNIPDNLPRGAVLPGGDGPFVELPWGWFLQQTQANEVVPSGYAMYGLTRVAQASGGRVFLYAPKSSTKHDCAPSGWGTCLFCSGDHVPRFEMLRMARLRAVAPAATSRAEALSAAARDPYFKATLNAWRAAGKAKLVRSAPSVEAAGGRLRLSRRSGGEWPSFMGSRNFKRIGTKAKSLARDCEKIQSTLEKDLGKIKTGSARYRAIADATRVMLALTHYNLLSLEAWCRGPGPALWGKKPPNIVPPERPRYDLTHAELAGGLNSYSMCLCHGVEPFLQVKLPGGESMRTELRELDGIVKEFMTRHGHTPFAAVISRAGIARFVPTVRGTGKATYSRKRGSSVTEEPTTPDRPDRAGSGSSTDRDGPTSGG